MATTFKQGQAWRSKANKGRVRYVFQNTKAPDSNLWRREEYGSDGNCKKVEWFIYSADWEPPARSFTREAAESAKGAAQ